MTNPRNLHFFLNHYIVSLKENYEKDLKKNGLIIPHKQSVYIWYMNILNDDLCIYLLLT